MLNWKGENEFEIGGVNFTIDITPGSNRRESLDNSFTLVKTRSYLADYLALQGERFEQILELGIFQGGSIVFFDKLFSPERRIGVDRERPAVPALERYLAQEAPHSKTH